LVAFVGRAGGIQDDGALGLGLIEGRQIQPTPAVAGPVKEQVNLVKDFS
jgi:hypothetical protein